MRTLLFTLKMDRGYSAYDLGVDNGDAVLFDPNGNILLMNETNSSKKYTYYPGTNRVMNTNGTGSQQFTYDASGNIIASQGKNLAITYDPYFNLPVTTALTTPGSLTTQYLYGPGNERMEKIYSDQTYTFYVRGKSDYPVMEITRTSGGSWAKRLYVYGHSGIIAITENAGNTWGYILKDHLGSTRRVLNNTNTAIAEYQYSPYGRTMYASVSQDAKYKFTGQELDNESNLYNFRARLYDTEAGLFYGADPARQLFASYRYCGNSPITRIDKDGKFFIIDDFVYGFIKGLTHGQNVFKEGYHSAKNPSINKLANVIDGVSSGGGYPYFSNNGSTDPAQYDYDDNGNLIKDVKKGISSIEYNYLNLPVKLTWTDNSRMENMYAADGTKLRVRYYLSSGALDKERNYFSGFEYEKAQTGSFAMTQFPMSEGRVTCSGSTYAYEYQMKDHLGNVRASFTCTSGSPSMQQEDYYYPFGLSFRMQDAASANRYLYNGKEKEDFHNLGWNDYGARFYDPQLGRWHAVDPEGFVKPFLSPYVYCFNNPIMFTDPTGADESPIYDPHGNLLGTDDQGLQGAAIIMDPKNFRQGMKHSEAIKFDLGISGLVDKAAINSFRWSYASLPSRPDWDGYLTLEEATLWYRHGNGQKLFADLRKIDLSGVSKDDFSGAGGKTVFNLFFNSNSSNDALVYGNITLRLVSSDCVRAFDDIYDFRSHTWWNPLNWGRNFETIIGGSLAGQGADFPISLYGTVKLNPTIPLYLMAK